MGRRQKQAAEVEDAALAAARSAALAAAQGGAAAGGPFAALSGLMGAAVCGAAGASAFSAGAHLRALGALGALGLFAPPTAAQITHESAANGPPAAGAGAGAAGLAGVAPAPGFSAADVATLMHAMAPGVSAPALTPEPPGASESAGAGAAWGLVAAETRGGGLGANAGGGASQQGG